MRDSPTIQRILVPIDFSGCSTAAVEYAAFLAASFGASLELLHVLEPRLAVTGEAVIIDPGYPAETLAEHARRIAAEELEHVAARLARRGLAVRTGLENGTAWERIVRAAETRAELVVMGTHGRTGLSRFLLGSVTDKVVQRSPVPVLTIRDTPREIVAARAEAIS